MFFLLKRFSFNMAYRYQKLTASLKSSIKSLPLPFRLIGNPLLSLNVFVYYWEIIHMMSKQKRQIPKKILRRHRLDLDQPCLIMYGIVMAVDISTRMLRHVMLEDSRMTKLFALRVPHSLNTEKKIR